MTPDQPDRPGTPDKSDRPGTPGKPERPGRPDGPAPSDPAPLPPYTVRVSPRARRVLLALRPGRGLEVVLPPWADPGRAAELVAARRAWIERTCERLRARGLDPTPAAPELPGAVALAAEGRTWTVHAVPAGAPAPRVRVVENADRLLLRGVRTGTGPDSSPDSSPDPAPDLAPALAALRVWLRGRARAWLPARLAEAAARTGLDYASVRLAAQRTRWASCSARGVVSLNITCMFLPPELVEQVLVHELCHRRHLDHSPRFWALVARHAPDWRERERALRDAGRFVPPWARP